MITMTDSTVTLSRESLVQDLRNGGFRLTPQREKILDHFLDLPEGEHLSAEELYRLLSAQDAGISLATLYRTLKLLASLGVLREVDFAEDHKHYELRRDPESPHHHMVCIECRKAVEFESPTAFALAMDIARTKRFEVLDVQLQVFGLCAECQTQRQHGRPSQQMIDSSFRHV